MHRVPVFHAALLATLLSGLASAQTSVTVQTDHGPVVGRQTDTRSFLEMLYAAPSVENLCEKAPSFPRPGRPRDATQFGNVCPQTVIALFTRPGERPGSAKGNED